MCSDVRANYHCFAAPGLGVFPKGDSLSEHTRRIRQIMAKKSSAKNSTMQLADDVLFGARVLYRELDDIFGHVSGRLPREVKREGLLFTRMRIAPKPLDPDEVMLTRASSKKCCGK